MPNGFHGTKEDWETAEAPLKRLDPELLQFANDNHMFSEANSRRKNWPMRSLSWGKPIERGILLSLDGNQKTYSLTAYAYFDDLGRKSRRRAVIFESKAPEEFTPSIGGWLNQARDLANSWAPEDLELIGPDGY
jgi:hypothetical protein